MRIDILILFLAFSSLSNAKPAELPQSDAQLSISPESPKSLADVSALNDPEQILDTALVEIRQRGNFREAAKAYLLANTFASFDRQRTAQSYHEATFAIAQDFINVLDEPDVTKLKYEIYSILRDQETEDWMRALGPPKYRANYMGDPAIEPGFPARRAWDEIMGILFPKQVARK